MNLFVVHQDPIIAARSLNDRHVVKMTLETAQILCSAANNLGQWAPYLPTHLKHPCVLWAAACRANRNWTVAVSPSPSAIRAGDARPLQMRRRRHCVSAILPSREGVVRYVESSVKATAVVARYGESALEVGSTLCRAGRGARAGD
jgi:hypothetical protein